MIEFLLSLLAATNGVSQLAPLSIEEVDGDPQRVKVTFTSPEDVEEPAAKVTLSLLDHKGRPGPPVFAKLARQGRRTVLSPQFRLAPGEVYLASADLNGRRWELRYKAPVTAAPAPKVTSIHPDADVLPANCLKFYVHFSQPMREEGGEIFELIRIENDAGERVPDPWRRVELWSNEARRLTLWIHPGRVKRGVNLRQELGPVLEPNRRYQLIVSGRMRSAAGKALGEDYIAPFRTTVEDRARLDPGRWKLSIPRGGTRDPLGLAFTKPLDHAQLSRMLTVSAAHGETVHGDPAPRRNDTSWEFVPSKPWKAGRYRIRISERLEDTAGNTPLRAFDLDLSQSRELPPGAPLELAFEIREARRAGDRRK